MELAGELASSPGELPSTAPVLPTSSVPSLLQQHDSMKRVGSVTQRMLSNPEPQSTNASVISPLPSDSSSVSSSSQGATAAPTSLLKSATLSYFSIVSLGSRKSQGCHPLID